MLVAHRGRSGAFVLALAVASACGDSGTGPSGARAPAVFVRALSDSLFIGRTIQVVAIATGDDSARVAWPQFAWSSSDTGVVVIDSTGFAFAVGPGTAMLRAEFEGKRDSVAVRAVFQTAHSGVAFPAAAAGYAQHCALTDAGTAHCRQLAAGDSVAMYAELPGAAAVPLTSLHVSDSHVCGLTASGVLRCWGSNTTGEFLTGSTAPIEATDAPAVGGGARRFSALSVGTTSGRGSTCGVDLGDALVYCAGQNQYFQLGRAPAAVVDSAVRAMPGSLAVQTLSLSAGSYACAIAASQEVYCWGRSVGVSGASGNDDREIPRKLSGSALFGSISATTNHVCGIATDGLAYCWGSNSAGQLGTGSTSNGPTTVATRVQSDERFVSIATAPGFSCGVTVTGSLYCWGAFPPAAFSARLGSRRFAPVAIAHGSDFVSVSTDAIGVCGITREGRALCF